MPSQDSLPGDEERDRVDPDGTGLSAGLQQTLRMLDTLPIPVLLNEPPSLHLRYANEAASALFGYSRDQLCSMTISELTAPEFRPEISDLSERLRSLVGVTTEKAYLHADGSKIHVRAHISPVPGFEHLMIAVIADTTALHRSLERAGMLSLVAALVSSADGGLDEVASVVQGLGELHLGRSVVVDWLPAPDLFGPGLPKVVYNHSKTEYWCAIVAAGTFLGSIRVADPVEVSDEIALAVESLAHCLAGAASVHRLTAALDASELFERAFESSNVGMTLVSRDEKFIRVNDAFARMVDRPVEELIGMPWHSVVHPGDLEASEVLDFRRSLSQGRDDPLQQTRRYVRPDGTITWGSVSVSPIFTAGSPASGVPDFFLSHSVDISQQISAMKEVSRTKEALRHAERRYRSLVDPAPDAVLRVDSVGAIIDANVQAQRMFTFELAPADEMRTLSDVLPLETAVKVVELLEVVLETRTPGEMTRERIDLAHRSDAWFRIRLVPEGREPRTSVHVIISDITSVIESERQLVATVLTDHLTGVPNRAAILDRLDHAIERLDRGRSPGVAVAVVNVDDFKSVNGSYGYAFGDVVLCEFAERIEAVLRTEDSVGRLSGDEFLIVLEDIPSVEMAEDVARRLSDSVNPLSVTVPDGRAVPMTASLGLAWVSATEPADSDVVVAAAAGALKDAKRLGRAQMWSSTDPLATRSRSLGSPGS